MNDWTGNQNSVYKTLGATNHTDKERESNDYYATEPKAIDVLLSAEEIRGTVWECACGAGHLSKRLKDFGYTVISTDLIDRGYGKSPVDFLKQEESLATNIITNPPYKYAQEFVEKAIELVPDGGKVAMLLRVLFLEGQKRKSLFEKYPPNNIYISSSRLMCAKNADFEGMKANGGSAVAYAWFVWQKNIKSETILKWVN